MTPKRTGERSRVVPAPPAAYFPKDTLQFITFVVENPGEPAYHYATFNGIIYGGWEQYEDLVAEVSQAALGEEKLWKTTTLKNPTVSDSGPLYPVPAAG